MAPWLPQTRRRTGISRIALSEARDVQLSKGAGCSCQIKAFAIAQNAKALLQSPALGHEIVRRSCIEFEHVVMTRNYETSANGAGKVRRLPPIKIPCYAALRPIAIDRQQGDIDIEMAQGRNSRFMPHSIAAVINREPEPLDHITEEHITPLTVAFSTVMRSGDSCDGQVFVAPELFVVQFHHSSGDVGAQAF